MEQPRRRQREIPGSLVQLCGINKHPCGYCKSEPLESSISYGMLSTKFTAQDYLRLMKIGWRRSGTYFYKPVMHKTCCPQYPIRLRVKNFTPSKSQKKVLKNVVKRCKLLSEQEANKLSEDFAILPTVYKGALDEKSSDKLDEERDLIRMEMVPAECTDERFQLYRKYQVSVHKDKEEELTPESFTRFLVSSPLIDATAAGVPRPTSKPLPFGTFHQLYRLRGSNKLIAVGVVDVLPDGLSGVYCYYDPDYRDLALGKYTALKEIDFCKEHGLDFYYMGYYIHTCDKMNYKAEYKPSELLCPTTFKWVLHKDCAPILDRFAFSPLDPGLATDRALLFPEVGINKQRKNQAMNVGAGKCSESGTAPDSHSTPVEDMGTVDRGGIAADEDDQIYSAENGTEEDANEQVSVSEMVKEKEEEDDDDDNEEKEEVEEECTPLSLYAPRFPPPLDSNNTDTAGEGEPTAATVAARTMKNKQAVTASTEDMDIVMGIENDEAAWARQCAEEVPLDVGAGRPLTVRDLTETGQKFLVPIIEEWLAHAGPVIGKDIVLKFA